MLGKWFMVLAAVVVFQMPLMACEDDLFGVAKPDPQPEPTAAPVIPSFSDPQNEAAKERALNKPTNDALDKPIVKLVADKQSLEKTLDEWAKSAGISMWVDWKVINAAGVTRGSAVTTTLADVPARRVLKIILDQMGDGTANLAFVVDDNRVLVSTREELSSGKYQVVRVYDLGFMFADIELDSRHAAEIEASFIETLEATVARETWRNAGGNVGSSRILNGQLIVNQTIDAQEKVQALVDEFHRGAGKATQAYDVKDLIQGAPLVRAQEGQPHSKLDELMDTIKSACGRDTWRDRGGKTSSMTAFDGKLYVTSTPAVHGQIESLLALMRKKD